MTVFIPCFCHKKPRFWRHARRLPPFVWRGFVFLRRSFVLRTGLNRTVDHRLAVDAPSTIFADCMGILINPPAIVDNAPMLLTERKSAVEHPPCADFSAKSPCFPAPTPDDDACACCTISPTSDGDDSTAWTIAPTPADRVAGRSTDASTAWTIAPTPADCVAGRSTDASTAWTIAPTGGFRAYHAKVRKPRQPSQNNTDHREPTPAFRGKKTGPGKANP